MNFYIIIVTHNSETFLPYCLSSLPATVACCIIVDSGSEDTKYLDGIDNKYSFPIKTVFCGNIGFGRSNNRGYAEYHKKELKTKDDVIVFLNPDAFFAQDTFEQLQLILQEHKNTAIISGRLLGCKIDKIKKATGRIDSTGIFRKWYGRWYDRAQGEEDRGQYIQNEFPLALCGAFLACRSSFLEQLWQENETIFDPLFFLYKEDIELSLRVRKKGWQLLYAPQIKIWHCRGWQKERGGMPLSLRRIAAENEIRLYCKYPSPYIFWAVFKYILVRFFKI